MSSEDRPGLVLVRPEGHSEHIDRRLVGDIDLSPCGSTTTTGYLEGLMGHDGWALSRPSRAALATVGFSLVAPWLVGSKIRDHGKEQNTGWMGLAAMLSFMTTTQAVCVICKGSNEDDMASTPGPAAVRGLVPTNGAVDATTNVFDHEADGRRDTPTVPRVLLTSNSQWMDGGAWVKGQHATTDGSGSQDRSTALGMVTREPRARAERVSASGQWTGHFLHLSPWHLIVSGSAGYGHCLSPSTSPSTRYLPVSSLVMMALTSYVVTRKRPEKSYMVHTRKPSTRMVRVVHILFLATQLVCPGEAFSMRFSVPPPMVSRVQMQRSTRDLAQLRMARPQLPSVGEPSVTKHRLVNGAHNTAGDYGIPIESCVGSSVDTTPSTLLLQAPSRSLQLLSRRLQLLSHSFASLAVAQSQCAVALAPYAVALAQFAVAQTQFAVAQSQFAVALAQYAVAPSQYAVALAQYAVAQFAVAQSQFAVALAQYAVAHWRLAVDGKRDVSLVGFTTDTSLCGGMQLGSVRLARVSTSSELEPNAQPVGGCARRLDPSQSQLAVARSQLAVTSQLHLQQYAVTQSLFAVDDRHDVTQDASWDGMLVGARPAHVSSSGKFEPNAQLVAGRVCCASRGLAIPNDAGGLPQLAADSGGLGIHNGAVAMPHREGAYGGLVTLDDGGGLLQLAAAFRGPIILNKGGGLQQLAGVSHGLVVPDDVGGLPQLAAASHELASLASCGLSQLAAASRGLTIPNDGGGLLQWAAVSRGLVIPIDAGGLPQLAAASRGLAIPNAGGGLPLWAAASRGLVILDNGGGRPQLAAASCGLEMCHELAVASRGLTVQSCSRA